MTILKFTGMVDTEDYTCESNVTIGGVDLLREIGKVDWAGPVTVAIADERFTGDLEDMEGARGYSEFTPGDPAYLTVGPHDILEVLERYDGKDVMMWVADEPVNTLEGYPTPTGSHTR